MEMITVKNDNSRFPFTSSQWQELEHQALVFKYMISGIPIPHDLLISIKTSLDSSTKLLLQRHSLHQSIGCNNFQMGFGRKIDPEPGRCRRTDGKKWRCSKEAYFDSKYCEKHIHRGRNRSRKPVETKFSMNSTPNPPSSSSSAICTKLMKQHSPDSDPLFVHPQLSSSRSPGNVLSFQDRFLLESNPYSRSEKDRSIISASVGDFWLLEPVDVNNSSFSSSLAKQPFFSDYQNGYSHSQLQNTPKRQKQDQERGYDQLDIKTEGKDEAHKVIHRFINESPNNDNDNDDHNHDKDSSITQLSISIPNHVHDFFLTRNDK